MQGISKAGAVAPVDVGGAEMIRMGMVNFDAMAMAAIFEAAVDSILIINEQGVVRAVNPSALQNFGYSEQELLGQYVSILMPEADTSREDGYLTQFRDSLGVGREMEGRRKDGSVFPLHVSVGEFQVRGQRMFVGICHDISERREFTERITLLANYDALTGCMNRQCFLELLDSTLPVCRNNGKRLAVLFIDLDGFKQINDNHGHHVGDRLLQLVVHRLQEKLRSSDTLARVGGDEFVVSLLLEDDRCAPDIVAERLVESLREPFAIDGSVLSVGASIGIGVFPDHALTTSELMGRADIAMYQAKEEGGRRVRVFDQALREKSEKQYQLLTRLRQAIEHGLFTLNYQLQFDLQTLQPSGVEALLRWHDAELGDVSPDEFIPVALEYGLMPSIGRWVIRRACEDNARLIADGALDVTMAVNVCAPLFSEAGFVPMVARVLADTGLPPQRLELEVIESIAMDVSPQVMQNSRELQALGVSLVMDDFGTGFSSLERLKQLRFDKLKIDRSFVTLLPGTGADQAIVQAVLGMAQGLGMAAIAEGIETRAQRDFLLVRGCRYGQGFWYARPMPLDVLQAWLRERT